MTGNADYHELHEKRNGAPIAWTKRARAAEHNVLPMRIGLKQNNLELGDSMLSRLSDPESEHYGMFLPEMIWCGCLCEMIGRKALDC